MKIYSPTQLALKPQHMFYLCMPERSSIIGYKEEPNTVEDESVKPTKDPAAVALGRRGGLVGGIARASKLSAEQRSLIAKKAAEKRWRRDEK